MAFHRCTIQDEKGNVVVKDVTVALEETVRAGGPSWYATITVTHLASLVPGLRYRLALDDGRGGEFLVRRNTFAGDTNRAVAIDGTGPLR